MFDPILYHLNADVRKWDSEQVGVWLNANGFGRYAAEFHAKRVDGSVLLDASRVRFVSFDVDDDHPSTLLKITTVAYVSD